LDRRVARRRPCAGSAGDSGSGSRFGCRRHFFAGAAETARLCGSGSSETALWAESGGSESALSPLKAAAHILHTGFCFFGGPCFSVPAPRLASENHRSTVTLLGCIQLLQTSQPQYWQLVAPDVLRARGELRPAEKSCAHIMQESLAETQLGDVRAIAAR